MVWLHRCVDTLSQRQARRITLAAQGFNLMDASVSQGFARQARQDAPAATHHTAEPEVETRTARPVHLTSLLDLYA